MADETVAQIYSANPVTVIDPDSIFYFIDNAGADAAALFSSLVQSVQGTAFADDFDLGGNSLTNGDFIHCNIIDSGGLQNAQLDHGTISTGTEDFSWSTQGQKQKVTVGGDFTITTSGWPDSGTYGEIEIEMVNGGAHTVTWPTVHWLIGDGTNSTTFGDMGVTLQASGTNFVIIWSTDGGTTVYGRAA